MFMSVYRRSWRTWLRTVLAIVLTSAVTAGRAQILDSVEVMRRGDNAEITIRFDTPVQYLRHNPADSGNLLRIFVRTRGIDNGHGDVMHVTKRLRASESVPSITVSFPEIDNSLLVTFDRPVRYAVHPESDGRSISVVLQLKPKE